MVSGKKEKLFFAESYFTIQEDTIINNKIKTRALTGHFMYICSDTLYMLPTYESQDIHSVRYKTYGENTDSIKYAPISEISRIIYDRPIGSVSAACFWLFAGTALVASPILSINRNGSFDTSKFLKISGISLGGAALCLGITAVFNERTLEIWPPGARKRLWNFRY
jgi:hypothetical protein